MKYSKFTQMISEDLGLYIRIDQIRYLEKIGFLGFKIEDFDKDMLKEDEKLGYEAAKFMCSIWACNIKAEEVMNARYNADEGRKLREKLQGMVLLLQSVLERWEVNFNRFNNC